MLVSNRKMRKGGGIFSIYDLKNIKAGYNARP